MLWSILIAGIPERYHSVQPLLHSLLEQQSVARIPDVELLYFMDNRRRPVGEKRNQLLLMAHGEYVSFIDDDDLVAPNYVQKLKAAIATARKNAPIDVICFPQRAHLQPAGVTHECTYSLSHYRDREPDKRRMLVQGDKPGVLNWSGPPAHTMLWRAEAIKEVWFPREKNFGEDVDWVDQACESAKTELRVPGDPLYFYNFNEMTSATR